MDREYVESSMITSFGFDPIISTLEIEFKSGAVWQYFDVPESVYYEMKSASSRGNFFRASIKGQYAESQVG
ncbi:KTSC domain-containing protein [Kaistella sp.]|uniref:KTSC domain-containing protein n=1 Tax=Kaistella sp. TaxID=2782235 RepID=UPI003C5B0D2B